MTRTLNDLFGPQKQKLIIRNFTNHLKMDHTKLVEKGAKWLKSHAQNTIVPNCPTVAYEITSATSTGETPDIIGWCHWVSVLIEVKVSRGDFLRDAKKTFRKFPEFGMGELRYFLCPHDMILIHEIPDDWGLLYSDETGRIVIVKQATKQPSNLLCERTMLMSIIRRTQIK